MLWLQDSEIITHLCCKDLVAAEEVTVWETSTWSQRRTSSLISADNHVSIIAFVMFCRIVLNRGGILWLSWTRQIQLLCSDLLPPSLRPGLELELELRKVSASTPHRAASDLNKARGYQRPVLCWAHVKRSGRGRRAGLSESASGHVLFTFPWPWDSEIH